MANLTKSKKWVILAIAIILMPFVENILGIRQLLTAYAEDAVSGEMLVKDPDGRVTVEKSDEHEADGNMVWTLTVHKENAENETSKVKVSLADETVVQGGTIAGDGFQASGSTLVENDYTNDKRVLTVTAPVGVTANLTVDYDLRQDIMPASKMDGEEGEEEPDQPATEITENVMATGQSSVGNVQLDTPDEVLQAIADAEAAAQAEAEAKAAAEAATQAAAEEKAAAEAAAAKAAAEEADRLAAEEKAAAEAATAQVEAEAKVEPEAGDQAKVDDQKDNPTENETDPLDTGIATVTNFQAPTYRVAPATTIETNRKDAKIANWNDRTYDITLTGKVTSQVEQKPADIVLVLDVSGSMKDPSGTTGKTRLQLMQDAATDLIEQLGDRSPTSRVGVVTFAKEGSKLYDFTTVTPDNVTEINDAIDNLSANGATSADKGMKLAYEMIRDRQDKSRPVFVMFLTDGVPTTSSDFDNGVASRAESYRSLIMGETATYSRSGQGGWSAVKGTYDSKSLGIGNSRDSRGVIVEGKVQPLTFAEDMQPTIYSVLQLNDYPENAAKTFMNYMKAGEKGKSLKSDSEEGLSSIFDDFLNAALGLSMKDTLDSRFEITEKGKEQITNQKGSISVVDGKTVVTFPLKANELKSYTFEVKAVDGYVGENAVPTNIPSGSGIMVESNLTEFVVGDGSKNIASPYVNVKLKDLKDVNTSEPQIKAGEAARSSETIRTDWTSGTQLTPSDGTNANDYDPELGSYPEVLVSGPENHEAYPTITKNYTGTATAKAKYATDDSMARAYADDEGQGSEEDAKGLAIDNNASANLTHITPVKAVPTITGNSKSAHLVDWDKRIYRVDLSATITQSEVSGDPLVLLILDASGSMKGTNLTNMKAAATGLVDNLAVKVPKADVGVISFGDSAATIVPFTSATNNTTIKNAIGNITDETVDGNATRADLGFKQAYEMLAAYKKTTRPVYIMYLTDGVPTSSSSFNNKVASDAQSYRSLILGLTGKYSNGWFGATAEKGLYDSQTLGESTWGSYHGIVTTENSNPPLNMSNAMIYSVLQAKDYSGDKGKPYMDFMASDSAKSLKAASAEDLTKYFSDFMNEIVTGSVVDTLDSRFELVDPDAVEEQGGVITKDNEGRTVITWALEANVPFERNFQIKAVDGYIGENVVPTNVPDKSGIRIEDGNVKGFDIYDEDGLVEGLKTPYVNVKLKGFTGAETSESIWLGQNAQSEEDIYTGWQEGVKPDSSIEDGYTYPEVVFDGVIDNETYDGKPETGKTYTETGTATANILTNTDTVGKELAELAKDYAEGYAFEHSTTNTKGRIIDNFTTGDFKHTVSIKTGEVSFDKYLEGVSVPDTVEDFDPEFTVSTTSIATQPNFEYQNNKLSLTNLGVGIYEITEKEPKGISDAEWVLEVVASPDNSKLTYTLKSGEDEVEVLDNYWNDFQIDINKKDGNNKDLVGAEFTLFDSNGEELEMITSTDEKPISLFSFTGLAPGSYTIEETTTPEGHVGLKAPIEIVINADGTVTVDGQDEQWVVKGDNNIISIIATNQAKGVLPATGGSGRQMVSFVILLMTMCLAGVGVIYVAYTRKGGV